MKILLAHEDRDLLRSYERLLMIDGHDVTTAFDGAQVASLLPKGPFGLVILEEALPRVAHGQLMGLLRRENAPVIVLLNGRATMKHLLRPLLPEAYLPLPFLPDDLTALIASVSKKLASADALPCGDAAVDVARFRFSGTDTRLTAQEIDLIAALLRDEKVSGRRARTMILSINEKLRRLGKKARVIYEIEKGYRLVNDNE